MVIPNFIKQALAGRPITVFGDGQQSRCFVHVSEIVEALIKIAANENAVGQVINLGSKQEITIEDLAVKVKRLALSASDIVYVPYDEAYESGFEDMERRVPDITKAKRLIGFNPAKDIDFIINNIIESESKNNYIRDHKTVISTVPLWHNRTNESICE
jgi:UDP-glucose 4-epimerase